MNAGPPKVSASVSPAKLVVILLAAAALGASALIYCFNPTTHDFYPVCQFHRLTGWNCPGCGATRAVYALLHGNISAALRDNALFLFTLAALMIRALWFTAKKRADQPVGDFFPATLLWPLLAVAVVFTVLRNLPAFAFLSP